MVGRLILKLSVMSLRACLSPGSSLGAKLTKLGLTHSLDAYLSELTQLVLKKNWSHNILKTILSSSQGNQVFIDWKIELKNLAISAPTKALTKTELKS